MTSDIGLRSERGPVLLSMMMSVALIAIESTVLATAVPSIVEDIGGFSSFPWLFSIYLLTASVTVPVYSKLADMIGRKPVMLFGIGVFLVASILAGFAWDMPSLILFRGLQGIGAGAVQPLTITVIGDIYTLEERPRVQGYIAFVWGAASVVGPVLGAVFAQLDAWRWIFFINIPLCAIAAWLLIRNFHERFERKRHRIDVAGAILVTASMSLIILGLLEGGTAWAWDSPASITIFALGGALLVAFLLVERRAAEPVLPLSMFRGRMLSAVVIMGVAIGAGLIGVTAFVPTYLEIGAGFDPIWAAAPLTAMLVGWPIAATLAGRLYLKHGFRWVMILGAILVVAGGVLLVVLAPHASPLFVALACLVLGFGFGWAAVPGLVAVQTEVPWHERAVVTGTVMFSRSFGQAIGAAVFGAIANGVIAAMGGDEQDPAVMIAASTAVFVGVAIACLVLLMSAIAAPSRAAVRD